MSAPNPVRTLFTDYKTFSGSANPALTQEICDSLGCPLGTMMIKHFADGETHLQIQENVRGADVFLVQPTCTPVDHHLMELLLMIDAFKRASAERITAVLPYYGYARQDRKDKPRMPISAKLVASLLERAGANRVLALDLHAAQIQGFFDIPVDHLFSAPVMVEYFQGRYDRRELTVVSPDAGGVERARSFAKRLNRPLAIIDKRRTDANVAEVMNIIGNVRGNALFDGGRSGGYRRNAGEGRRSAAEPGREIGYRLCHSRGFIGTGCRADQRFGGPGISGDEFDPDMSLRLGSVAKIRTLSVAPLLARAIQSIHEGGSISTLFI